MGGVGGVVDGVRGDVSVSGAVFFVVFSGGWIMVVVVVVYDVVSVRMD